MMACWLWLTCTLTFKIICLKHVPGPRQICDSMVQVAQCQLCLSILDNLFTILLACRFGGFIGGGLQAAFGLFVG